MSSLKGPGEAQIHDGKSPAVSIPQLRSHLANTSSAVLLGSNLRIAIVHARWNTEIISALVAGARKSLLASGVKEENILVQDVPGSYELPFAVQRMYTSSQIESSNNPTGPISAVTDLLSSASLTDLTTSEPTASSPQTSSGSSKAPLTVPFAAVIAIGVLIKGETMHFEYIADATAHGLMKVQLDLGVPIVFGLLTVLNEEQGRARAGIDGKHCHGEDWGRAAVELGVKRQVWAEGKFL